MHPTNRLILGTVQFGLPYGINNQVGKPSFEAVSQILDEAYAAGIRTLDTANAYGDAEQVIGQYHQINGARFSVISKLHAKSDQVNISEIILSGLTRLRIQRFEACLFHSFADYVSRQTAVEQLRAEKQKGLVCKIGVSVYTNEEFTFLVDENKVDLIQLPFNLLDNNNQRGALIKRARAQGIIIHARSVFLQGLFFKSIDELPVFLQPLRGYLAQLHAIAAEENIPIGDLALNYVLNNPAIDGVLIGVDHVEQLRENIQLVGKPLSTAAVEKVERIFVHEQALLNPVNWR